MKKPTNPIDRSSKEKFERQIIAASQKGEKDYTFNVQHDPCKPAEFWFQESNEGLILFVVFYTMACRWSQCLGCNLPSKMSVTHIDFISIMAQVDDLFSNPTILAQKDAIRKVIISNNGSVLDEVTFSSTALMYLIAKLNIHLVNMSVLSIETRPEFVDLAELEFIDRALKEGDTPGELEVCIGFEAFDDNIRNNFFRKGLPLETFEELVAKIAPYKYHLKCYFMLKPVPGISDAQAVEDIHQAIDYLADMGQKHDVNINMHLNPTYVATGTVLEKEFKKGNYSPPLLLDVARAARKARDKNISVFLGLSDEGLAVPGGSFIRDGDEPLVQELERFNRTGDYSLLDKLCP